MKGGIAWNGSHWFVMDTATNAQHGGNAPIHMYDASYNWVRDITISDAGTFAGMDTNTTNFWVWDTVGSDLLNLDYEGNILYEYPDLGLASQMYVVMNGSNVFVGGYYPQHAPLLTKLDFAGNIISSVSLTKAGMGYGYGMGYYDDSFYLSSTTGVYRFYNAPISEEEDETPPVITWEDPTPTDDDTINKTHVYLNTTITDDSNTSAWFDWNKTLKGYWAMDFYNSTGIYDNSTYNNFGVFHNMSITNKTDGKFGDAFNFSGSNYKSHMDMGNDSSLIFSDALTIDLWIKPAVGQETCYDVAYDWGNNGIIGSVDGADSTSTWSYQLRYGSPQNCSLGLQLNTVAGNKWVTLGYNLSTEDWSHIVATFDGTDEKIYVNGSLKNTTTFAATTLKTDPNNKIIVGVAGWGVSNTYYEGEIDEIKIHNRAISLEEVKASYNNGVYKLYNNFTGLSNGNYTYSAYAIDTSGNLNITTERKIKILSNCWTKTTWGYFNPTDCVFEMEIGVNYEN